MWRLPLHGLPPYSADTRTRRRRSLVPPPHDFVHSPQPSQASNSQSMAFCIGTHAPTSLSAALQALPPLLGSCWTERVRYICIFMLFPSPQVDQSLQPDNLQSYASPQFGVHVFVILVGPIHGIPPHSLLLAITLVRSQRPAQVGEPQTDQGANSHGFGWHCSAQDSGSGHWATSYSTPLHFDVDTPFDSPSIAPTRKPSDRCFLKV